MSECDYHFKCIFPIGEVTLIGIDEEVTRKERVLAFKCGAMVKILSRSFTYKDSSF